MKRDYSEEEEAEFSDDSEYTETGSDTEDEDTNLFFPILVMEPDNYYKTPSKKQKMEPDGEILLDDIRNMSVDKNRSILERIVKSDFDTGVKKYLVDEYDEKEHSTSELTKFTSYVEKVLKIPVKKYKKINPNSDNISKFIMNLREKLDDAIAGHNETKTEIIDHITCMIRNPGANANILALQSKPGCGKTRFVRALGKALDLPFSQISFGGLNDPAILTGHDFTYIGSKPGKIYDVLCKSGFMNGVVMLDEIDKIGDLDAPRTKEVYGVLTHILDKEQNSEFYDNYIGTNIPIDLSKILFIASFNNEYNIDPIVLNRMKVIKIKESTIKEKIEIVKKFSIPEITKNLKLSPESFTIKDDVIKYVIINKTVHEAGMRNINKNFTSLFGRINTVLYLEHASEEQLKSITKDLVYENVVLTRDGDNRITVTTELVDKFIPRKTSNISLNMMYN
jgi:ATP-dependent Lon protease